MSRRAAIWILALLISSAGFSDAQKDSYLSDLFTLLDAIKQITAESGPFSLDLVEPMIDAAALYAEDGDFELQAMDMYESALNILHRQQGVHTPKQIEILNRMAPLTAGLGDLDRTTRFYRFRHEVHRQNFGDRDSSTVEAQLDLGYWLQGIGSYSEAKATFTNILDTLGPDPSLGKLRWRAANAILFTQYLNGTCCDDELLASSLEDLINDPATDQSELLTGTLLKADLQIMGGERSAIGTYQDYGELNETLHQPSAQVELLGISRLDHMIRAYLETAMDSSVRQHSARTLNASNYPPGTLLGSPMPFCANQVNELAKGKQLDQLEIHAKVTLTERGKVKKIRIVESNAPRALNGLFRDILRSTRFRPAMIEGEVARADLDIHQRFDNSRGINDRNLAFPPSITAAFHGCHLVAEELNPRDSGPAIAIVQ